MGNEKIESIMEFKSILGRNHFQRQTSTDTMLEDSRNSVLLQEMILYLTILSKNNEGEKHADRRTSNKKLDVFSLMTMIMRLRVPFIHSQIDVGTYSDDVCSVFEGLVMPLTNQTIFWGA